MRYARLFNKVRICRHGLMVFNPNDAYVGRSLDLYGEFTEAEIELLGRIAEDGAVVVDVGACIGTHTIPLARAVGPTGTVYAFEPQRLLFQTLCANLALNSITNVFAHQAALGDQPGVLFAQSVDPRCHTNFAGLSLRSSSPGEPMSVITLDGLELERLHLVKIDVEGMEHTVIEGAVKMIARCRPVLYVENDRNDRSDELIACIARQGYRMFWHTPMLYNPENFMKCEENVFGEIAALNLLCLPEDGRWVPEDFADVEGFSPEPVRVPRTRIRQPRAKEIRVPTPIGPMRFSLPTTEDDDEETSP
ncbi:FkbM family methyltransferase [Candidatus Fermentibacteria bacterium]|nr:FkbM family methyltransferase [Candidatus Fermentibacteria bacterium]